MLVRASKEMEVKVLASRASAVAPSAATKGLLDQTTDVAVNEKLKSIGREASVMD